MDIDLCVNGTPYHLRPPMLGLKRLDVEPFLESLFSALELLPHCRGMQKEPLGILLGGSFLLWINYRGKYNLLSMK